MIYHLLLRPDAEAELLQAKDWYEKSRLGLGEEFEEAVASTLERIAETPQVFPKVHGEIRCAILRRFPYAIYFRILETKIVIIAVFHSRRDPRRWQSR